MSKTQKNHQFWGPKGRDWCYTSNNFKDTYCESYLYLKWAPQGQRVEPNNILGARRASFSLHFDCGPKGHWPRCILYHYNQISLRHHSMQGNKKNEKNSEVFMNFEKKIYYTSPHLISFVILLYNLQKYLCMYLCLYTFSKLYYTKTIQVILNLKLHQVSVRWKIFSKKILTPPLWCHRRATMLT